ncbi:MAG: pyridoxamine 5'-phosphate oxidase family protein [Candidatus Omnitrophica bacterium]|nr:pyridoxamine 5'-phosphate oxidase family protein [Candidatus Omnitrophota bacterium]
MEKLNSDVIHFFQNQGFVIVSTIDDKGMPHNSCKGIVEIKSNGEVFLLDLYHSKTYANLNKNPSISITAVDEHKFKGYCLKGITRLIKGDKLDNELIRAWEDRITSRLTQRVLKNISGQKGHARHPEIMLPEPKYLIQMQVEEIVDLAPHL